MRSNILPGENARNRLYSTVLGCGSSLCVMLIGATVMTILILEGYIKVEYMRHGSLAILLLSSLLGSKLIIKHSGSGRLQSSIFCAASIMAAMLLLHFLIYGGKYNDFLETLCAILIGGALAMLFPTTEIRKNTKRR